METVEQIRAWQQQIAEAPPSASANLLVAKRLLAHGAEALSELARLRAENEALRDLLCSAHAGALAYRDDGEMQDNTARPCIDFKRYTPEQIRAALRNRRREEAARAAREGE